MNFMKIINSIVKFLNSILNIIISAMVVFALIIGIYATYDINSVYKKADINKELADLKPGTRNFSIKNLQEINPDICGWIRIDGTNIDYPVLQGKDNTLYMSKDYKKEYSAGGSIFLDYRNNENFEDDYSILFGHNMKEDMMFSDVRKFLDKNFFDTHTTGRLYVESTVYKIDVYAVSEVSSHEKVIYDIRLYANDKNKEVIDKINEILTFKSDIELNNDSKILALSTCSSAGTDDRTVLFAKLTETENSDELIEIESNINSEINVEKEKKRRVITGLSTRGKTLLALTIVVIIIFIIAIKKSIENKKYQATNKKKHRSHSKADEKRILIEKRKELERQAKKQQKTDLIEQKNLERLQEIEKIQEKQIERNRKKGKH